MSHLHVMTAAEQVASFLRGELMRGAWSGRMPGGDRLAAELGIGRDTVETALGRLEEEGLLINQGRRRGRKIADSLESMVVPRIRVAILAGDDIDRRVGYLIDLRHVLAKAGHDVLSAEKTMVDLRMNVQRVGQMVARTQADAWVVLASPRDLLEWFVAEEIPAIAVFGRRRGLRIAGVGPDKPAALAAAARSLLTLGHRRIVLLARPRRRLPEPGVPERAFLNELAAHGITPGPYHLPDWQESVDEFHACLDSLFRVTPPTALIIDEAPFFVAVQQFLAGRGLRVPEDVSLVCTDSDPAFDWCKPSVAHIRWDSSPVVHRIVRWAANVSRGKADFRQTTTPAVFVPGGTVAPPGRTR